MIYIYNRHLQYDIADTPPMLVTSLWDLLRNQMVALEGETLLLLLRGVAAGMAFLHAHDPPIVHSDLKSSNILVSGWFQAKVCPPREP
jgi:serine/threonine protein kinase